MTNFPKRLIILGSSGFIGSHIFEQFKLKDNLIVKGFSSENCDLLSFEKTQKALSDLTKQDTLVMAAAITRLKDNSLKSLIKNIKIIENVTRVIKSRPIGQLVFLSSVDVYGINIKRNTLISEKLPLEPNDYYSLSKIVGEFLFKKTCRELNIPLSILRLSGVYGPGDNGISTIGAFISSAVKRKEIYIYGKGRQLRDYVYVGDICNLIEAAMMKKMNNTINVAVGKSYSIIKIVKIIESYFPYNLKIIFNPETDSRERRIKDVVFDSSLFRKEFPSLKMSTIDKGVCNYLNKLRKV